VTPEECLKSGDLAQARALLQEQVRKEPAAPRPRIFLFQLLAVSGEWERALTQLNVLSDIDATSLSMVQAYREALRCEVLRAEVFAGKKSPVVLGEPEPWLALVIEALRLTAEGRSAQAKELRERAFEDAAAFPGTIDGSPFEWVADADPRLGPILEVLVNGRYYWVPFQRIRALDIEPPADLRDFVWAPVRLEWANAGEAFGLLPTRYAGSEASPDPAIRLARKTVWEEVGADTVRGLGHRMLATDRGEFPILDVRSVRLATAVPAAGP
jgi:type VI secretion system protein ImpE